MFETVQFRINTIKTFFKKPVVTDYYNQYKSRFRVNIADKFGLKKKYNVTDIELIKLTCGCPMEDFTICDFQGFSVDADVFKTDCIFKMKGKKIASFERTIDFKNMEVINDKVIVKDEDKGISTNAFLNQLAQASKLNFTKMTMQAAGGVDYIAHGITLFQGYHKWAKYGYLMDDDSEREFQNWLNQNNLPEKSLWQICMNKNTHELWKATGFSWEGTFEIGKGSKSLKLLKKYLVHKQINVSLSNLPL